MISTTPTHGNASADLYRVHQIVESLAIDMCETDMLYYELTRSEYRVPYSLTTAQPWRFVSRVPLGEREPYCNQPVGKLLISRVAGLKYPCPHMRDLYVDCHLLQVPPSLPGFEVMYM